MKRSVRRVVDVALPLLGMLVIFGSVLFGSPNNLQLQVILLLIGVLILEAGVWGLTSALLPNERRYPELRQEVDDFIELVRELNVAARETDGGREDDTRFQSGVEQMHVAVERMAELARKAVHPVASEAPAEEASVARTAEASVGPPTRTSAG